MQVMLTGDQWRESKESEVVLHGVDPDALECMLRLVYGGKVDISTEPANRQISLDFAARSATLRVSEFATKHSER